MMGSICHMLVRLHPVEFRAAIAGCKWRQDCAGGVDEVSATKTVESQSSHRRHTMYTNARGCMPVCCGNERVATVSDAAPRPHRVRWTSSPSSNRRCRLKHAPLHRQATDNSTTVLITTTISSKTNPSHHPTTRRHRRPTTA